MGFLNRNKREKELEQLRSEIQRLYELQESELKKIPDSELEKGFDEIFGSEEAKKSLFEMFGSEKLEKMQICLGKTQ